MEVRFVIVVGVWELDVRSRLSRIVFGLVLGDFFY